MKDTRDDEASVFLVVRGYDVPGGMLGAGRRQALLVDFHVVVPEPPLLDIREAELPVPVWIVDPLDETPPLLLGGEVQEELSSM